MVVQSVTLHLNAETLKEIDALANKTRVTREQIIAELVHERSERERVRARIAQVNAKKRASKRGKQAIVNFEKRRSGLKQVSEKEFTRDLEEALAVVRQDNHRS